MPAITKVYYLSTVEEFAEWVNQELAERGWSMRELARRAGLSSAALPKALSGQRGIGVDLCQGIARAFGVPVEDVYRRARLLPPANDDERKRFEEFVAWLTPQEREEFWDYIEIFKASIASKRTRKGNEE